MSIKKITLVPLTAKNDSFFYVLPNNVNPIREFIVIHHHKAAIPTVFINRAHLNIFVWKNAAPSQSSSQPLDKDKTQ